MKKVLAFLLLILSFTSFAQVYQYRVEFKDKNNSPYSLQHPEEFLSKAAIDRRIKQKIIIDSLDLPVNPAYILGVENFGVKVFASSKWLNSVVAQVVDTMELPNISKLDYVKKITFLKQETSKSKIPITPVGKVTKGIKHTHNFPYNYGYGANVFEMINLDSLHLLGFDGEGVTIAVIDGGFYRADSTVGFEHIWQTNRILGWKDFVNKNSDIFEQHWHGTAVLSVMGVDNSGVVVGTSPKASFWLLRSEDINTETWAEEDYWVSAVEFADSVGVWITNSSLGYSSFNYPEQNYTWDNLDGKTAFISRGATIASTKGLLNIISMGNEGSKKWHYLSVPADARNVLSVAAVDGMERKASFSSVGLYIDDYIKPDISALGESVGVMIHNEFTGVNGTSFSSPVICGAAACLWQAFPCANSFEIMDVIRECGDRANNPDTLLGYGIPDFMKAFRILEDKYGTPSDTLNQDSTTYIVVPNASNTICQIYPNPFTEILTIVFTSPQASSVTIELYSVSGERVYSLKEKSVTAGQKIFLPKMLFEQAGTYFIHIKVGKQKYVHKVIRGI